MALPLGLLLQPAALPASTIEVVQVFEYSYSHLLQCISLDETTACTSRAPSNRISDVPQAKLHDDSFAEFVLLMLRRAPSRYDPAHGRYPRPGRHGGLRRHRRRSR